MVSAVHRERIAPLFWLVGHIRQNPSSGDGSLVGPSLFGARQECRKVPGTFRHCGRFVVRQSPDPVSLYEASFVTSPELLFDLNNGGVVFEELFGLTGFLETYVQHIAVDLGDFTATKRFVVHGIAHCEGVRSSFFLADVFLRLATAWLRKGAERLASAATFASIAGARRT